MYSGEESVTYLHINLALFVIEEFFVFYCAGSFLYILLPKPGVVI